MESSTITITLPPEGTTARNLVIDFICKLSLEHGVSVNIKENDVVVSGISLDELLTTINGLIKRLGRELVNKISERKLRDMPVHRNDYKFLSELSGTNVSKGSKFADIVSRILLNTSLTLEEVNEWSKISVELKGSKIQVILGSVSLKNYPLPQPLLTERFEASHMFMHGIGGKSIKIRATKPWIILLLAGFAISYGGMTENIIYYIHVPEEIMRTFAKSPEILFAVIDFTKGFIPFITTLNMPSTPRVAYILYLASQLILEYSARNLMELLETMVKNRILTFNADRIRFDGNTFTMVERFSGDLYQIVSKMINLKGRTLRWIRRISRTCLLIKHDPSLYTIYSNLCNLLYSALVGSGSIFDALYYAGRVVMVKEMSSLESQGKRTEAIELSGRYKAIFHDLIEKLS